MSFKFLSTLLLAITLTASAFAAPFTSTEGRFTADFITAPKVTTDNITDGNGRPVVLVDVTATTEDGDLAEIVSYADYAFTVTENNLQQSGIAAFADKKIDGKQFMTVNGRQEFVVYGSDDTFAYFYANYGVGNRLYQIIVVESLKKVNGSFAADFLLSVK